MKILKLSSFLILYLICISINAERIVRPNNTLKTGDSLYLTYLVSSNHIYELRASDDMVHWRTWSTQGFTKSGETYYIIDFDSPLFWILVELSP